MIIRHLEISNFRSLESVKLEEIGLFNVLIGRNNSGKSTIFGALALLNNVIRGQSNAVDWNTVLTGKDQSRSLEILLRFETLPGERDEFIRIVWSEPNEENQRKALLDSAFLRQIEFRFKSPAGKPDLLHLRETRTQASNGEWATIQKMVEANLADELSMNPQSYFKQFTAPEFRRINPIKAGVLNITGPGGNYVANMSCSFVNEIYAGTALAGHKGSTWPLAKLDDYLRKAFFFNPFRHSESRLQVSQTEQLSQNGSNLAQILHTINSNDPRVFRKIEQFLQAALPDIGMLTTPLLQNQTEVGFRHPEGDFFVRLHDMGGGIEQLLMIAIVLNKTGDECALFIEEPESHLHAGAQRFLIEKLLPEKRQIFLTTHSPTFVNMARSSSMYQVRYSRNTTTVARLEDRDMLGTMLFDIGSRNSDVLLSNAVLFVEGPGDRDVFNEWSKTLKLSFEERNITLFPMGGGEHAERTARVRSEVLAGISQKSPVPHLFILDGDERSDAEIKKLHDGLGDKLWILGLRELENYLVAPRAILLAMREKCENNEALLEALSNTKEENIDSLLRQTADDLYGLVLLKRIRAELAGLPGGLLTRESVSRLVKEAKTPSLSKLLKEEIDKHISNRLNGLDLARIVKDEKAWLDKEWKDKDRRLELAPGEELIAAVFGKFGLKYKKPNDTARIAKFMTESEMHVEIIALIKQAADLPSKG
jgi:predicted ATP-dependent endonuclease of OLD family